MVATCVEIQTPVSQFVVFFLSVFFGSKTLDITPASATRLDNVMLITLTGSQISVHDILKSLDEILQTMLSMKALSSAFRPDCFHEILILENSLTGAAHYYRRSRKLLKNRFY